MKRALWIVSGTVLFALGSLFAFAAYVLSSEWGLPWVVQRAAHYAPGELSVQSFSGTLRGPIVLEDVAWHNEEVAIEVGRIELEWEPLQFMHGEVRISRLAVDTVNVQTTAPREPRAETTLKDITLPLKIRVQHGVLQSLSINSAPEQPAIQIDRVAVDAQWFGDVVQLHRLEVAAPAFATQITGQITTRDNYPLTATTAWSVRWPEQPELRGEGLLSGDLTRLQVTQKLLAPVSINVDGTLIDLLKTPQWELRAVARALDPQKIKTEWVFGPLDVEISAHSAGEVIESQGAVKLTHQVTGPLDLRWKGRYEKTRVTFDEISAQLTGSAVRMQLTAIAELNPQATYGIGNISATGNWSTLGWPLRDAQQALSANGKFSLSGTPDEYRFTLAGPLRGENFPNSDINLAGVGHSQDVKLESIDVVTLDGTLHGSAALQWGERLRWQAQVRGARLNPGVRWSEWPGRLNFVASADGEMLDGNVIAQIDLTKLEGELRDYPLRAQSKVSINGSSYTVHRAEVNSGTSRLSAQGSLTDIWSLDWNLDAPNIATLYPALSGTLSGNGKLRGPRATSHIQYAVQGRNLVYQSVRVGQLESRGDVNMDVKQPSTLSARAAKIEAPGWKGDELQFNLDGALEAHRAVVRLRASDSSADIVLSKGSWISDAWSAQLERAELTLPRVGHWSLDAPVELSASTSAARWVQTCWRGALGHLCTQGEWAKTKGVDAQATLTESSLEALQSFLPEGVQISGGLKASLQLLAPPPPEHATPILAKLNLQLAPGNIVVLEATGESTEIEHRGGKIDVLLDAQGARAEGKVDFAQLGQVVATAQLPGWELGTEARNQPLIGNVQAEVRELEFLARWLPTVEQIQGALKADVRIAGSLAEPRFDGDILLSNGAATLPQQGIKLREISVEVRQHSENKVEFHASAKSGPGTLELRGDFLMDRAAGWPLSVEVTGKDFEMVNLPEAWVLASPELSLSKVRNRIDLGGVLQIPRARYTARDVSSALSPSSDVVMVGSEEKIDKEEKWKIYTAVRFAFGNDVSFNGFGLKGLVRGEVVAMDEPKKLTTGYGELQMVDATFNAYKIDLKVTRGRLLFAGGPINNPGIDARAVREVGSIRQTAAKNEKSEALRDPGAIMAGVQVRGTLRKLELTLFSDPPHDQADVLSLMLFGVPLGDATSEEGKALFIAASSLRLTGRDDTLRKIGRRFGIDEIRLDAGSTPEQASLVIGRYLGPRLYINYSVGLISTGLNVLRVRYRVSDKWMLQSEQSDAESAADLLYTFER